MPKKKKFKSLLKKSVLAIVFFLISATAGFYYNDFLEKANAETSLEVIMPNEPNLDGSFDIVLSNTGDTELEIKKVDIRSCYMDEDKWRHYYPDNLPSGKEFSINFVEEETSNKSLLIDCKNAPLKDWEERRMNVTICKNFVTGDIYIPTKNNSFNMCGFCMWRIRVETEKQNFTFNETIFMPINFAFEVLSSTENKSFDMNSPDVSCTDDFKMAYYGTRELEIEGEYD